MNKRKHQLIFILSLLLITGFLITSLASYLVSRSSLRAQLSQNELPITSDNIYSEIQRDLLRPIFISSLMSTDTFLRDWVLQGEQDPQKIAQFLREIQDKYKTTSFFVSEKSRLYYHAGGILKKVSPTEERDEWYFRVREMTSDFEINVDPDMANHDAMTVFVNYRVFDYDNNFIAATGVGLTVNAVKDLIESYQQKYGRNIFFVDTSGAVKLYGSTFPAENTSLYEMDGISSIADEILSAGAKSLHYKRDGKRVYLNSRFVKEFGWYLIVEQADDRVVRNILHALLVNLLICSVITAVVIFLTNMTISTYQKRLEIMATTDKLTGIFNRQSFDVLFTQTIKDALRKDAFFSVILIDLDHFKQINDTYGHLTGDAVICHVTKVFGEIIRSSDVLCRWGGEEFIVLLKECHLDDAYIMAEKIRTAVNASPTLHNGIDIPITVSSGVAEYHAPEEGDSLLARVDTSLYCAKKNGRDRTEK